ncbi:lipopolysaccharide export system protein LptC [Sphingomonas zeicaulis]|uniref:LPS export ABC transporter periplasmic protein LptC n=1 Tax=Sphingomonas zeicaulis TaxID=1632740 RepID=UPI003D1B931F
MSEIAVRKRSLRQRWAAPGSRHDRLIAVSRVIFPTAIGALVAVLAIAPLTRGNELSFVLAKDSVEIAKERMKVTSAIYRGEDSKGQAFQLRAGSAVQASSRDPVVRLEKLSAELALKDGPATVTAPRGRYDMNAEKVAVDGPVQLRAADGYRLDTRDVAVDLRSRQVTNTGPVDGAMTLGTFSAEQMRADLEARTVTLQGRARLHIVQRRGR